MMRIVPKNLNIDFMSRRFIFMGLSVFIIVTGMTYVVLKGGFEYGIDFTGGILIQIRFAEGNTHSIADVRKALKDIHTEKAVVQDFQGQHGEYLIKLKRTEKDPSQLADEIVAGLKKIFGEKSFEVRRVETVGARVGKDLKRRGILSVVFAIIGMLLYITWRFQFSFGLGAIVALVHDVLITLSAIRFAGKEIDLVIIASLLTIVGYSVNDTIVVYDRIRENIRKRRKDSIENIINVSISETLSRTILTSITTLIMVASLFIFGGGIIHDFAFVLLVGIITGTYSSIFIASPVVISFWKGRR